MCVRFSGQPDEVGFIMLHVDINQHSPSLVGSVINVLHALKGNNHKDSIKFLKRKLRHNETYEYKKKKRCGRLQDGIITMILEFFIMGVKGNEDLFGDGVLYQGVWDDPKQFRGQTGAQDDIIPMEDILAELLNIIPKMN